MKARTIIGYLFGILVIGLLLWLGIYAYQNIVVPGPITAAPVVAVPAGISAFIIQKPSFVVDGSGLSRVEVWATLPTAAPGLGEGIAPSQTPEELLGTATLQVGSTSSTEIWALPIPTNPVLATSIFAKGYDATGALAGQVSLPYSGTTDIYNAIWNQNLASSTANGTIPVGNTQTNFLFTLGVGEKGSVGALTIKLLQITGDSRCPQNAVCIVAGNVTARVELTSGTKDITTSMTSDGSPFTFGNYQISMAGVDPARSAGGPPAQSAYQIQFAIQTI